MDSHLDRLFDCRGALAGQHAPVPDTWDRFLRVDIHCHLHSDAAEAMVRPYADPMREPILRFASPATRAVNRAQLEAVHGAMTSTDARLRAMDATGIDVQVVSPSPGQYYYWADPEVARAAAQAVNDDIAAIVASDPDRFAGLGTVPMQHPDLAIAEMERLHRELGLRGIEIGTSVEGVDLERV